MKLTLRPTVWYWSRMNQSPVATPWPSMVTWVRLGEVPRMLTRSFSSKPPSPLAAEFGVDARDALQGVGDVLVGQLADVVGRDGVDLVGRVAS